MTSVAEVRDLGAPIAQKRLPPANAVIVLLLSLVFAWVALRVGEVNGAVLGMLAFAMLLAGFAVWGLTYRAAIYEQGAMISSFMGTRKFNFRDLKEFAYSRTVRGGQLQDLITFYPRAGKPFRIVTQPTSRADGDQDLGALVQRLSGVQVERMTKELERRKRVPWIARVTGKIPAQPAIAITRDGYVVNNGESDTTVRFVDSEIQVSNGIFIVTGRDSSKPIFQVPCSAVGFHPGFHLIGRLLGDAEAPQPASAAVKATA